MDMDITWPIPTPTDAVAFMAYTYGTGRSVDEQNDDVVSVVRCCHALGYMG